MIFALLSAFFTSLKDLFGKKASGGLDEYIVALSLRVFSIPLFLLLFFFSGSHLPENFVFSTTFLSALVIGGLLNVLANILYMRALKLSDISLTVPLIAFTPVFLLVVAYFILGEAPSLFGIGGIALVVLGAYFLNIAKFREGFFRPIQALFAERGPRIMFLVAFLWSITSSIDKIGVTLSSPLLWVLATDIFILVVMVPIVYFFSRSSWEKVKQHVRALSFVGVSEGIASLFQMMAISTTLVPYVIALKRTSILWSALWGGLFLKEKDFVSKMAGIGIMVIGIACIVIWA